MAGGLVLAVVGLVVLAAAAVAATSGGPGDDRGGTSASTVAPSAAEGSTGTVTTTLPPVPGTRAPGRSALPGFGDVRLVLVAGDGGETVLCVLLAATEAQRARGLMEVTDPALGGYDGMVFRFDADVTIGFWMRNTPMPLRLAYAEGAGKVLSTVDMKPCADEPTCPTYPPTASYRLALEVPRQARLAAVVARAERMRIGGRCAAPD